MQVNIKISSLQLIERFNKYGICLAPSSKYDIMDEIGKHNLDKAVELVKGKKSFVIVLDNIDWTLQAHDARNDNQNKSVHAVASCLVFDHVSSSDLPNDLPQIRNAKEKVSQAIQLTNEEMNETTRRYQTLVARIPVEFLPFLKPFAKFIEPSIKHKHSEETKKKSIVVNLPIIMKDEKKYSECVEIMGQLETWVEEIMTAANVAPSAQLDSSSQLTSSSQLSLPSQQDPLAQPHLSIQSHLLLEQHSSVQPHPSSQLSPSPQLPLTSQLQPFTHPSTEPHPSACLLCYKHLPLQPISQIPNKMRIQS